MVSLGGQEKKTRRHGTVARLQPGQSRGCQMASAIVRLRVTRLLRPLRRRRVVPRAPVAFCCRFRLACVSGEALNRQGSAGSLRARAQVPPSLG